jgi:hypothetical protein
MAPFSLGRSLYALTQIKFCSDFFLHANEPFYLEKESAMERWNRDWAADLRAPLRERLRESDKKAAAIPGTRRRARFAAGSRHDRDRA